MEENKKMMGELGLFDFLKNIKGEILFKKVVKWKMLLLEEFGLEV